MNTIAGKVTVKESGIGVPDLLVVIYDLDPDQANDERLNTIGDRIGSVITDSDGSWSLSYEDEEFRVLNKDEKRPDLQLTVLAPEDADTEKSPIILFSSKVLRVNSGRTESYLIRVTEKQLLEAEITLPIDRVTENTSDSKIETYRAKKTEEKALRKGIREVNEEINVDEDRHIASLGEIFKKAILPNKSVLESRYNFVSETGSIENVQKAVFDTGALLIENRIDVIDPDHPTPGKGIRINLILTDDEKSDLANNRFIHQNKVYYKLNESEIQKIISKREDDNGVSTILFSNNPIGKYCSQKSADEKCALLHTQLIPADDDDEPAPTTQPDPPIGIQDSDIPIYLEKILANKHSDQFQTNGDYSSQRSTGTSIQANVDGFALQKGPADATAFYDFHSLQIAFDYVWHQLLDESLVDIGKQIHISQETSGTKGILQSIKENTADLDRSGIGQIIPLLVNAQMTFFHEVPTEISQAFDISLLEYDSLTSENKSKLEKLAKDINKFEVIATSQQKIKSEQEWWNPFYNISNTVKIDYATQANVLRDQGERLIDNVRINKPFSTNQLLKELQERLLSKYEFTVFAANKDYHSVNFGLMNTFRQKWEPISYQAGKLVKTIPLSPKEERKYSVKTNQNTKITRKQAQKNNSMLQQEINTTSRAESEIVAKAQDKSNFNMSVKLDYSKITSEVGFGKTAEKESTQSRKDFREAVIKAAQEFRDERSLEVDTEESYTTEYNESGTIVNPNDELSVTYLFYELQRRYRVSEQLYRVMPVVLVAQEVPSPDQITEAWIITHDWILNRNLLDDSFRNTLQYLAQKNIGDDFAIRELRKNLRHQRTLVNNLQVEFSKLKFEVENKYASLQDKVSGRIDEEHDKRFYKWWWWWGHDKRPDEPPDPEMAKAMEQAASDDHKHAVEQAERMALSVQREVNTLQQITADYNAVMRDHLDRLTQTRRLITHIKENILYYMQAIWSMEPPDQRFMRLYKVDVPYFDVERNCVIQDEPVSDVFAHFREEGDQKHVAWLGGKIKRRPSDNALDITSKQLVEVADLDTLLGFKGNYMIFPLKEHNGLTNLMAAPYIDEAFGAMDPDELSNINLEEFSKYICCLHQENPEEYERVKPVLKEWLSQLLADPLRNGDEIIVPTGSLFIEMLPSDKSLMEDFKLKHREWDVYKVQAEVRKLELENIRYAARLLKDERGDPDTDKKIVVVGDGVDPNIDVDN